MRIRILLTILFITSLLFADYYVVNSESETLSKYDAATSQVNNAFAMLGQGQESAPNIVRIWNNYAIVVITYENALQKIDLDNPSNTCYIYMEDSSSPNYFVIDGDTAYVNSNDLDKVYKVDLQNGTILGTVNVGRAPEGMAIYNNYLYVACTGFNPGDWSYGQGEVYKINLNDFTSDSIINCSTNPRNVVFRNDKYYVVCTGNFDTETGKVDIYNASSDSLEQTFDCQNAPGSIYLTDNYLFLGNSYPADVFAFNMSDLSSATGSFSGGNVITGHDNLLVSADAVDYIQNSHIYVYDINNAFNQTLTFTVGVGVTDIVYHNPMPVANEQNEVVHFNIELSVYPNPFNPETNLAFNLKNESNVNISIYNIRGQKVRTLADRHFTSGNHSVKWNGKDDNGGNSASGVYFARIITSEGSATKKLIMMK